MARLSFTILGCGSSGGVPRLGGRWGACDPANPKNRRRRCALLVERIGHDGITRVLIDTGPDMVPQLLDAGVGELDAVVCPDSPAADPLTGAAHACACTAQPSPGPSGAAAPRTQP